MLITAFFLRGACFLQGRNDSDTALHAVGLAGVCVCLCVYVWQGEGSTQDSQPARLCPLVLRQW